MIIQITRIKNELFLLEKMLPIWQKYADGFVFLDDKSTDGTYEYLIENKQKFNILSILKNDLKDDELSIESDERQLLFNEALKYSGNIVCLDADEYLDGTLTKEELEQILDSNKDSLFYLNWIQYTGTNTIRVDGKWADHIADRVGSYSKPTKFKPAQMHSEHIPHPGNAFKINPPFLFVAHLQWLDKKIVAIKQYFWKIVDYVNKVEFNATVTDPKEYDKSVNDFKWQEIKFDFPLKVEYTVYEALKDIHNYKLQFIQDNIKKYNIPNLNDWNMKIHYAN